MTNSTYTDYNFTANGVNFISRVYSHSDMATIISQLPEGVFAEMNKGAVKDLIGDPSEFSTAELLQQLSHINAGGSGAFILLGDNN